MTALPQKYGLLKGVELTSLLGGVYWGVPIQEAANSAQQIAQRLRFKKFWWRFGDYRFDYIKLQDGTQKEAIFYEELEEKDGRSSFEKLLEETISGPGIVKMYTDQNHPHNITSTYFTAYATYLSPTFQVNLTLFDKGIFAKYKPLQHTRRACLELLVMGNPQAIQMPTSEQVDALYQELASLA